jgi:hypothetical protein
MRIPSLLLAAGAAMLLNTGCMTDDSMAKSSYTSTSPFEDNIDYAKVNRVEEQVRRAGYSVTWVHLPVKKRFSRSERVGVD